MIWFLVSVEANVPTDRKYAAEQQDREVARGRPARDRSASGERRIQT